MAFLTNLAWPVHTLAMLTLSFVQAAVPITSALLKAVLTLCSRVNIVRVWTQNVLSGAAHSLVDLAASFSRNEVVVTFLDLTNPFWTWIQTKAAVAAASLELESPWKTALAVPGGLLLFLGLLYKIRGWCGQGNDKNRGKVNKGFVVSAMNSENSCIIGGKRQLRTKRCVVPSSDPPTGRHLYGKYGAESDKEEEEEVSTEKNNNRAFQMPLKAEEEAFFEAIKSLNVHPMHLQNDRQVLYAVVRTWAVLTTGDAGMGRGDSARWNSFQRATKGLMNTPTKAKVYRKLKELDFHGVASTGQH
eukprot:CAMPEP_0167788420 /NCGR_PEP_ID=MMETSP0111_2-20121227/10031_1 /TAXON_ID=91324 /ORGANISM="Lotharella globosa, Strain CCCM811" /LENGTH=301 /DNA_ID=CAMNT_0007680297 /DNA_START=15 /DNA_END=920 /DNA_ORIENTATION=+